MIKRSTLFIYFFIVYFVVGLQLRWTDIDNQAFAKIAFDQDYGGEIIPRSVGVLILLAGLLIFINYVYGAARLLPNLFFLGLVIPVLSIFWTIDKSRTANAIVIIGLTVAYTTLAVKAWGGASAIRMVWMLSVALLIFCTILGLMNNAHVMMFSTHEGTWRGLFNHKNVYGPFVTTVLIVTLFGNHLLNARQSTRVFVVLLCLLSLYMAKSSTAIGALFAACAVMSAAKIPVRRTGSRAFIYCFAIVITAIVLVPIIDNPDLLTNSLDRDVTLTGRTTLWRAAIPYTLRAPFGYGFGTSGGEQVLVAMRSLSGWAIAKSTHSVYITRALDVGWPGMALMVAWLIPIIFVVRHDDQFNTKVLLAGLATVHIVGGFTEVSGLLFTSANLIFLLLTTATIAASRQQSVDVEAKQPPDLELAVVR